MPPTRTIPPAKAVKTERTHEENQERAYIAASRRSDRSLEARVESARRASEIHKRRTGRSLRVTEQDVINEEMYEEEDDDLPLQYRRLTAHLQTGSADFNRRLAAYLTNQVAMRSAMDQMINNGFSQQYPNAPQFPQAHQSNFPTPLLNPGLVQSPTNTYRSSPYPSPYQAGFRPPNSRAQSMAAPADATGASMAQSGSPVGQHGSFDHRRMSTPANIPTQGLQTTAVKADPDYQRQTQSATTLMPQSQYQPMWQEMNPFTTSLPLASQQLLGPALDPNDPFTSMLMAGSEQYISNPYYPWGNFQGTPKAGFSTPSVHPSYNGMSATLAPSALDAGVDNLTTNTTTSTPASTDNRTAPSSGLAFNLSQDSSFSKGVDGFPSTGLTRENSGHELASGQITPGEGFWDSFVEDGGWSEEHAVS